LSAIVAGLACIVVGGVGAVVVFYGDGGSDHEPPTDAAVVWGNPIPRSLFSKGMSIRISSIRAQTGTAPKRGSVEYRRLQDDAMRQLVSDLIVVSEARKLGLVKIKPPVVSYIVQNPAKVQTIWSRLYDFAARSVPDPEDPKVVNATHFDEHELPELLTPHQLTVYNNWQARRDRVASTFFGQLFERYRAHTSYAQGFRPS
jgi:SurA-like N-terminal domain